MVTYVGVVVPGLVHLVTGDDSKQRDSDDGHGHHDPADRGSALRERVLQVHNRAVLHRREDDDELQPRYKYVITWLMWHYHEVDRA